MDEKIVVLPQQQQRNVVSYKFKVMTGCKWTDNYQSAAIRSQFHLSGFIQELLLFFVVFLPTRSQFSNLCTIEKIDQQQQHEKKIQLLIFLLKKFTKDY